MQGDIHGLESLLFDEDMPDLEEGNEIQKILNGIGVNYMHRNDNLIQDSVIEERRVEALLEVEPRCHTET